MAELGPLLRVLEGCHQGMRGAVFLLELRVLFQAPVVVGRIQYLVIVGLRVPGFLLATDWSLHLHHQVLEAPCCSQSHGSLHRKPTSELLASSRPPGESLISRKASNGLTLKYVFSDLYIDIMTYTF